MKTIRSTAAMQRTAASWQRADRKVGFVPTMGAMHEGHLSLIRRARKDNELVVVSIYVNPTQFDRKEDLQKYPRMMKADLADCRKEGTDVVFAPASLFANDHSTWVEEVAESAGRCGATRPGHFRGVTTVLVKLLNLVKPTRIYMGWKDAQQLEIVTRMVRDLNMPVKVVGCPIVRDPDGLALSSRNKLLSPEARQLALAFPRSLKAAVSKSRPVAWLKRELAKAPGIRVDYVEIANGRLCGAVFVGGTRLIDNCRLPRPSK